MSLDICLLAVSSHGRRVKQSLSNLFFTALIQFRSEPSWPSYILKISLPVAITVGMRISTHKGHKHSGQQLHNLIILIFTLTNAQAITLSGQSESQSRLFWRLKGQKVRLWLHEVLKFRPFLLLSNFIIHLDTESYLLWWLLLVVNSTGLRDTKRLVKHPRGCCIG